MSSPSCSIKLNKSCWRLGTVNGCFTTVCSLPLSTSCFETGSLVLSETKLSCSDTNEVGASQLAVAWMVKGASVPARNGMITLPTFRPECTAWSSSGSPERYQLILTSETSARLSYQPISNWYRRTLYCSDTVSLAGPSTTCTFQTVPGFMYMCTARKPYCIALWPCHICNHNVCR